MGKSKHIFVFRGKYFLFQKTFLPPILVSFFVLFQRASGAGGYRGEEKMFANLTLNLSNFVSEKGLKVAYHSNFLKLNIFSTFKSNWRKKSWNGKVGGKKNDFGLVIVSSCV